MKYVFGTGSLALASGIVAQGLILREWNWTPNIVFALLLTLAFFLPFEEFLVLLLGAMLMMTWSPLPAGDLLIFGFLLVVAFSTRRFLPWIPWISNALLVFLGTVTFYVLVLSLPIAKQPLLWVDAAVSAAIGTIFFFLLHDVVGYHVRAAR